MSAQTREGKLGYQRHLANVAAVDHAIRGGDGPTIARLAKQLGCDARTIYRYLVWLRELGAPLPKGGLALRYAGRWNFMAALRVWMDVELAAAYKHQTETVRR